MSDLFNKLAMRRKGEEGLLFLNVDAGDWNCMEEPLCPVLSVIGISGKGPAGGESSDPPAPTGGAFARMSDAIPPLPAPQSTTDDDDWEA